MDWRGQSWGTRPVPRARVDGPIPTLTRSPGMTTSRQLRLENPCSRVSQKQVGTLALSLTGYGTRYYLFQSMGRQGGK